MFNDTEKWSPVQFIDRLTPHGRHTGVQLITLRLAVYVLNYVLLCSTDSLKGWILVPRARCREQL
mgnify:CR=1 FL=1